MTKIQFEVAPKPTKAQKQQQGQTGFVVIPTRWVIERSNVWVEPTFRTLNCHNRFLLTFIDRLSYKLYFYTVF
jgi:hypothetical protein